MNYMNYMIILMFNIIVLLMVYIVVLRKKNNSRKFISIDQPKNFQPLMDVLDTAINLHMDNLRIEIEMDDVIRFQDVKANTEKITERVYMSLSPVLVDNIRLYYTDEFIIEYIGKQVRDIGVNLLSHRI